MVTAKRDRAWEDRKRASGGKKGFVETGMLGAALFFTEVLAAGLKEIPHWGRHQSSWRLPFRAEGELVRRGLARG